MTFNPRAILLWLIGLGLFGAIAFFPLIYSVGRAVGPPDPARATIHAPPLLRAAIWANANGNGEPRLEPLTSWSLFSFVSCRAYTAASTGGDPPQERGEPDPCLDRQAGVQLAGQLSREHVNKSGIPASLRWALSQESTTANLTRNWAIDSVLDTLAAT